jgi:hypothetical protein
MKKLLKVVVAVLVLGLGFAGLSTKEAKAVSPTYCADFSVKVGDKIYTGNQTIKLDSSQIKGKIIQVFGKYVSYNVNADTFGLTNYAMTDLNGENKTIVFKEKTPMVTNPKTSGVEILIDGSYVRLSQKDGYKLKYQTKNCTQGGTFQIESDSPVIFHHELGEGFRYYKHPTLGKYMFTNGLLYGYESPEQAKVLSMNGNISNWGVYSGGRMGMVTGNDASQYIIDYAQLPDYPTIGDVNAEQVLPADIAETDGTHQERSQNRTNGGSNGTPTDDGFKIGN